MQPNGRTEVRRRGYSTEVETGYYLNVSQLATHEPAIDNALRAEGSDTGSAIARWGGAAAREKLDPMGGDGAFGAY